MSAERFFLGIWMIKKCVDILMLQKICLPTCNLYLSGQKN